MSARADEAKQLVRDGFTIPEICEKMGIKRAWAYTLLSYRRYRNTRMRQLEAKRRDRGERQYECGVCGALGHNAGRHRGE